MSLLEKLWVERYRPRSISECVFQNEKHRLAFTSMVESKTIPHLMLAGVQGTGKTTLAQILIKAMELDETDVMYINASMERGIDVFRDKIVNFAGSMSLGPFKVVFLEEAHMLTLEAQNALKAFMEEVSDTVRFVFTCNIVNKIIPPIRSRCQEFTFAAADIDDVTERMLDILRSEGVRCKLADLDQYVNTGYPDIRKVIQLLQQNTVNKVLLAASGDSSSDFRYELLDLINDNKWTEARKLTCASMTADQWDSLYTFIYHHLHEMTKFKKQEAFEEAVIIISEHLYRHTLVADPEINAAAMFIRLGSIK